MRQYKVLDLQKCKSFLMKGKEKIIMPTVVYISDIIAAYKESKRNDR